MNERAFLDNIANRLRRPRVQATPARDVSGSPDFWTSRQADEQTKVQLFCAELANLGGQAWVCASVAHLHGFLADWLAERQPARVGLWDDDFADRYGLRALLSDAAVTTWAEAGVAGYAQVDVSITGCAYAVADTGTLVLMSSPVHGRSAAVLPTVHLVLVHRSQLRLRLGEVLQELAQQAQSLPSGVHFISGPSRSSDIENDQTIGIHGPAEVIAAILP